MEFAHKKFIRTSILWIKVSEEKLYLWNWNLFFSLSLNLSQVRNPTQKHAGITYNYLNSILFKKCLMIIHGFKQSFNPNFCIICWCPWFLWKYQVSEWLFTIIIYIVTCNQNVSFYFSEEKQLGVLLLLITKTRDN